MTWKTGANYLGCDGAPRTMFFNRFSIRKLKQSIDLPLVVVEVAFDPILKLIFDKTIFLVDLVPCCFKFRDE